MPVPIIGISPFSSISDLQISPAGTFKQLSQLNPKKACGPDEIPARVLQRRFHTQFRVGSLII